MIAVLFGTFNSRHAANALLVEDLRRMGAEVRFCHEPLWEETRDKLAPYFAPLGLARLLGRWVRLMARLALRFRAASAGADVVVAGFNGQLDVLVARLLARGRRILFAPLVTITETLVDDRAQYAARSSSARLFAWIDRASLRAADVVLADTSAHRAYLCSRLGVPPERVVVQYLGAEPQFAPGERRGTGISVRLRVLGYGTYLPLHGSAVVAEAARLIAPEEGIVFELIGSGPAREDSDRIVRGLRHVHTLDWVPYEELPQRIREADVVLGIFGASAKARMVIPNKIYQAAQVGRAIVTADTPAIREVFAPDESIVLVAPEPGALAAALRALAGDPVRRERLGEAARDAVARAAGSEVRAARLADAFARLGLASRAAAAAEVRG